MAATLKQIAELAGVSRGTVDRALYDRGRVDPQVAKRVKKIAKELGYTPNTAGRALALSKNPIKIGIVIQFAETPFMQEVDKGVRAAANEIENMGGEVYVRMINGLGQHRLIEKMEELRAMQVNGIALVPSEDKAVHERINSFVQDYDIPIVTINTDIPDSKRLCYVGQDALKAGRTAGGLMGAVLGGRGTVSVISGFAEHLSLQQRAKGFQSVLNSEFSGIKVLPIEYAHDEEALAQSILRRQLKEHPDIGGILVTSNGDCGICEVLREQGLDQKVKVICFDTTEKNVENLANGSIDFVIDQEAYLQGYEPIMVLYRKFFENKSPQQEYAYTEIKIATKYTL